MNPDPFRVLHVCVGNVCRSVLAEHLMRDAALRLVGDGAPGGADGFLTVASAGMQADPGRAMHPDVAAILASRGIRPDGFRTTRFTPAAAVDADLILTASRAERNLVVAAKPAALRRTFTLNEFARLAPVASSESGVSSESGGAAEAQGAGRYATRARLSVATALTLRGYLMPDDPSEDDIADPNPTLEDFTACAVTIAGAVGAIVDALFSRAGVTVTEPAVAAVPSVGAS